MANHSVFVIFATLIIMASSAGCTGIQESGDGSESYSSGISYPATVLDVIDGDTVRVVFPDGTEERVRLLGVDTPETDAGKNLPQEYGAITDPEYLASWGLDAAEYTESVLEGAEVVLEFDRAAGIRDRYGRMLAYLYLADGDDFGASLVRQGYARVYTEEQFAKEDDYLELQEAAIADRAGLWNHPDMTKAPIPVDTPSEGVFILMVHGDAAGDDRTNLNDEYIVIANNGPGTADTSGWTITENGGAVYTFGTHALPPGTSITLHTGSGNDSATDLYWGQAAPVLNNDHDGVFLYDRNGTYLSGFSWERQAMQ